jgi:topoisomerase-4 subunit A
VFGSNGRVYSVAVASLPAGAATAQPITSLIDLEPGTQPRTTSPAQARGAAARRNRRLRPARARVATSCRASAAARASSSSRRREAAAAGAWSAPSTRVACLTLAGRLLVFAVDEVKLQGNGGAA